MRDKNKDYKPGHGRQSDVFCIFGPPQGDPAWTGVGLLHVLNRFCPWAERPGHLQSIHGPQVLQPPSTIKLQKK